jgi:hypothetical protein
VTWWPVVVFGVALTAVLVWTFLWARGHRQTTHRQNRPAWHTGLYVQHAARDNRTGEILFYYRTEASKEHDTRWCRNGDGAHSVAAWFRELPDGRRARVSAWQRTYAQDFKTLQRMD